MISILEAKSEWSGCPAWANTSNCPSSATFILMPSDASYLSLRKDNWTLYKDSLYSSWHRKQRRWQFNQTTWVRTRSNTSLLAFLRILKKKKKKASGLSHNQITANIWSLTIRKWRGIKDRSIRATKKDCEKVEVLPQEKLELQCCPSCVKTDSHKTKALNPMSICHTLKLQTCWRLL